LLIQNGLYRPVKISQIVRNKWNNGIKLRKVEIEKIFMDNPQNQKKLALKKVGHQDLTHGLKLQRNLDLYGIFCKKK
jgi:hypothetical protein